MVVMAQQVSWQILQGWTHHRVFFPHLSLGIGQGPLRFLEESELLKFLNELREARPELSTDDINRFCAELAVIRREGVGFDCEEILRGSVVAAPIFDYTGNLVATIGCSVPTVRITEESSALLIREVIQTAAAHPCPSARHGVSSCRQPAPCSIVLYADSITEKKNVCIALSLDQRRERDAAGAGRSGESGHRVRSGSTPDNLRGCGTGSSGRIRDTLRCSGAVCPRGA